MELDFGFGTFGNAVIGQDQCFPINETLNASNDMDDIRVDNKVDKEKN
jgi:hypothetical protein